MTKRAFDKIAAGLRDAASIERGELGPGSYRAHVPETVNVKATRKHLGLTQTAFAAKFGFSTGAVRDWEQNRKQPEATARVLLTVIEREPEAVQRALAAMGK